MKDIEFEKRNKEFLKNMLKDEELRELTRKWFNRAFPHEYSYHFTWLGRPIFQFPQDLIALQELIWKIKPELIIETGIARGGSIIFSASMLEMIGGGEVVGIDIDIRKHNRKEIENHHLFKRITMFEGPSTNKKIIAKVQKIAEEKKKVLVLLDSNHTHKHVLEELKAYSPFVKKGGYIIVYDTMVEDMPKDSFPNRPWNKGNNPKTAVHEFLKNNKRFKIDKKIEEKLLITSAPDGYLKCMK